LTLFPPLPIFRTTVLRLPILPNDSPTSADDPVDYSTASANPSLNSPASTELFYDSSISAKLFPNSFANPLLDSTASTELLHESPVSINQNYECPPSDNFATPAAGITLAIIQALPPAMVRSQIIISVQLQQQVLEFLTQSRKNSDELLLEYKKLRSAISQEYPEAEVDRIVASYIDTDVQALIAASRQRKRTLDTRINAKIAALQAR
jgi:lambda repressor-like predicted transcriptional regulator